MVSNAARIISKATEEFLEQNVQGDYSIQRLNDRAIRRQLKISRKNVYLVKSELADYVLLDFSSNYKAIFNNYLAAKDSLKDRVEGRHWKINRRLLLILMPFLGNNLNLSDRHSLKRVYELLVKINGRGDLIGYYQPRHLSSPQSFNGDLIPESLANFVNYISLKRPRFRLGNGIEDPAFYNFTERNGGVYLIDLDNFSSRINIDYELGFLMVDVDLLIFDRGNRSLKSLVNSAKSINYEVDITMLLTGYVSRLTTVLLDYFSGEAIDPGSLGSICLQIDELCADFLSTFE